MTSELDVSVVEAMWRRLSEQAGKANTELDIDLNLPVVIGCTAENQPYIMLLSEEQPRLISTLEAVNVRIGRRQSTVGEDWSLTFILQDWSLLHAFAEICLAFVERIRVSPTKKASLRQVYATLDQWQRLLKTIRQSDTMTMLRGVFGELVAALEIVKCTGKSIESVCEAWSGPYSMPQDFSFDQDNSYWEVKSLHKSTNRIQISSPQQLDSTEKRIQLVTVVLESFSSAKDKLLTLPQLVDKLRSHADDPALVSSCIDNGLSSLGMSLYSDVSAQTLFEIGKVTVYAVANDFPYISSSVVPSGVSELTYSIEQSAIAPFITRIDLSVLDFTEG